MDSADALDEFEPVKVKVNGKTFVHQWLDELAIPEHDSDLIEESWKAHLRLTYWLNIHEREKQKLEGYERQLRQVEASASLSVRQSLQASDKSYVSDRQVDDHLEYMPDVNDARDVVFRQKQYVGRIYSMIAGHRSRVRIIEDRARNLTQCQTGQLHRR